MRTTPSLLSSDGTRIDTPDSFLIFATANYKHTPFLLSTLKIFSQSVNNAVICLTVKRAKAFPLKISIPFSVPWMSHKFYTPCQLRSVSWLRTYIGKTWYLPKQFNGAIMAIINCCLNIFTMRIWNCLKVCYTTLGMNEHPIRISRSGWISTIRWNHSSWITCFKPDRVGANYCVDVSQTICHCSVLNVWLMLSRQSVHCCSQQTNDPCLALMYVEVLSTQWTLHRNMQMGSQ